MQASGPDVFTLAELVRIAGRLSGHHRVVLPLPDANGRLQAMPMEWLPGKTLTGRDNVDSMQVDSVAMPGHSGLQV